jgi:site-specific DNA recombinase
MAPTKRRSSDAVNEVLTKPTSEQSPGRPRKPGRGLPSDEALRDLALTYQQAQRSLWPEVAQKVARFSVEADVTAAMAEQFRDQFLAGSITPLDPPTNFPPCEGLAASYVRYSSDNSNPRSLDQQLRLQLERAKQNGHFIPWTYIFADAAVSGTTADRRGYEMAKQVLSVDELAVLYIDEIGRASRDAVEAMRLGRLVEKSGKRLIGVSDSFDSSSAASRVILSVFATLQEWFINQLRSKVNRGMKDAFCRGTNVHPPSLGYNLVPALDGTGRSLFGQDGERLKMKIINTEEAVHVLRAFERYTNENWSLGRIARDFNEKSVGNLNTWDHASVGQVLRRRTYVGVAIYRQTYQVRDPDTGKVKIKTRPRKDWLVRRMRHLQIVPWGLWKLTQKRLEQCREVYASLKKQEGATRTDLYPKVLIRPVCGSCGSVLTFGRSGKYASFCCPNGIRKKHGCKLKGYKALRIIEDSILDELHRRIITPKFLKRLLTTANEFLAEEARRPREDIKPLQSKIRSVRSLRDRLIERLDDQDETGLDAVFDRVRQYERQLKELHDRLNTIKTQNAPPPPLMTLTDLESMMDDLRGLHEQNVALAAPLLKSLTGPIVVEQVIEKGRKKPVWVAKFSVNAVPVLAKLAASRDRAIAP